MLRGEFAEVVAGAFADDWCLAERRAGRTLD
jgi:hypothetical protein